ncbi:hypothetical protein AVEN_13015-1 [Araneus ventricosus]|uniref:Uncharacterized protein n=1 Tax=Araneus ventricosus TaxID=182803 RepID=A0A4Y2HM10_ARAVE|nr:hypothetical protein AVEN_13015-1 [Araneus ventricosus]
MKANVTGSLRQTQRPSTKSEEPGKSISSGTDSRSGNSCVQCDVTNVTCLDTSVQAARTRRNAPAAVTKVTNNQNVRPMPNALTVVPPTKDTDCNIRRIMLLRIPAAQL